jgi:hypothetical protein
MIGFALFAICDAGACFVGRRSISTAGHYFGWSYLMTQQGRLLTASDAIRSKTLRLCLKI